MIEGQRDKDGQEKKVGIRRDAVTTTECDVMLGRDWTGLADAEEDPQMLKSCNSYFFRC